MQVQDLRIGDLVRLKSKSKSFLITRGVEIDIGCESEDFEPIPLTDPIFDTVKDGRYTPRLYFQGGSKNFVNLSDLTYFHELQLLVKALTGKEYIDIVNQSKYF